MYCGIWGAGEVAIEIKTNDDGCVLTLQGDDVGFIIGRRGETLDALQYLTGLVANGWTMPITA